MNSFNYKHLQSYEKQKLEKVLKNQIIFIENKGMTDQGWRKKSITWKVDINYLATFLNRARKTIKRELLNGSVENTANDVAKRTSGFIYSAIKSEFTKKQNYSKNRQNLKIEKDIELQNFVIDNLQNQSLKSIAGRSKLLKNQGILKNSITAKTLYNYIDNNKISFINETCLIRVKKKHKYRTRFIGKRLNGISIDERPDVINNRERIGDFEADLIEGKRKTHKHLLVLIDRKTKLSIIRLIDNKKTQTIKNEIRNLQKNNILVFGKNCLSMTLDNGSEFWGWNIFCKSIENKIYDIDVFFCHPYCSWEKGTIEQNNSIVRQYYPKGTDFSKLTQVDIDIVQNEINNKFRESLGYKTSLEMYNENIQT